MPDTPGVEEAPPEKITMNIVERVMIPIAYNAITQVDEDTWIVQFVTPAGRSYEFFVDDDGRERIHQKTKRPSGLLLPQMPQLPEVLR